MNENETVPLATFLSSLKGGEDVVVEYRSEDPLHVVFNSLLKTLRGIGKRFVILDELDQLHIIRAHTELSGMDAGLIDECKVIKLGGIINTGNVIGRIELSEEPPLRKKRYERILKELGEEKKFRIMVGFDKLLRSYENDPRELEKIFGYLVRVHLGNPERVIMYLINREIIGEKSLKELREHATRVLELNFEKDKPVLRVIKSIHTGETGRKIKLN